MWEREDIFLFQKKKGGYFPFFSPLFSSSHLAFGEGGGGGEIWKYRQGSPGSSFLVVAAAAAFFYVSD